MGNVNRTGFPQVSQEPETLNRLNETKYIECFMLEIVTKYLDLYLYLSFGSVCCM